MNETREYAWVHFAAANASVGPVAACQRADLMLAEFDRRFGPCELCDGKGWKPSDSAATGHRATCEACGGSGHRTVP